MYHVYVTRRAALEYQQLTGWKMGYEEARRDLTERIIWARQEQESGLSATPGALYLQAHGVNLRVVPARDGVLLVIPYLGASHAHNQDWRTPLQRRAQEHARADYSTRRDGEEGTPR
jgi:hypothetical protein